jgi:hypothetical protein
MSSLHFPFVLPAEETLVAGAKRDLRNYRTPDPQKQQPKSACDYGANGQIRPSKSISL